jgi:thiamine transport system permease protein
MGGHRDPVMTLTTASGTKATSARDGVTKARVRIRRSPSTIIAMVLGVGIPLVFLSIFFLLPVLGMLSRGFLVEGGVAGGIGNGSMGASIIDLGGFAEVFSRPRTLRLLGLTVGQAALAALICTAVGLPIAHVLYRLNFRGRALLRTLIVVPFVLPTVVVGVAFRTLLSDSGPLGSLQLDGTFTAIMLALVFFNIAVVVRTVGGTWEGLDVKQEDAARVLGATPARVWVTVTFPRLLPSILAAASVVFLFCATAFGVVLVLGGVQFGTIETEIYLLTTQFLDLRAASVLSITQLVIVVGVLVLANRAGRIGRSGHSGQARSTSRTGATIAERRVAAAQSRRRPRRADAAAIVVTLVTVALLALPILTMIERSLRTAGAGAGSPGPGTGAAGAGGTSDAGFPYSFTNYLNLATTGQRNALVVPVWTALGNSLTIAAQATAIALIIGVLASVVISRRPRNRFARSALDVFDGALMLPLGISAVTVGFGFLITLNQPPLDLRSSPILIPIAQALVALPLVVRIILPVLRGVDSRMRESASVLGAPPWRVLQDVDLAIAARPVLAAAGLAFAVALGEFGATTFLSRLDHPTLPVVIYRLIGVPGGENFGMALAASVVLATVTVAVMALVERLRVGSMGTF